MAKETKEPIPYDLQVLLPCLKKAHNRISNGYFTPRTWNALIDLYNRLPRNVRKSVSIEDVVKAEDKKEICVKFFLQMKEGLENKGYLRRITRTEEGVLSVK